MFILQVALQPFSTSLIIAICAIIITILINSIVPFLIKSYLSEIRKIQRDFPVMIQQLKDHIDHDLTFQKESIQTIKELREKIERVTSTQDKMRGDLYADLINAADERFVIKEVCENKHRYLEKFRGDNK